MEGKQSKDPLILLLDSKKMKGYYEIEQQFNIISITLSSQNKRKMVIATLSEFGYDVRDYIIPDKHQCKEF